jgi:hypothetical protein
MCGSHVGEAGEGGRPYEYITGTYPYIIIFYGCETWSLSLREELILRVFENRVLRRIFGRNIQEVIGWRKLRNATPHDL